MAIYCASYFPLIFKIVLSLLVLARFSNFAPSLLEVVVLLLLSVIAFTAHYGVWIDKDQKIYLEYFWLLGLKIGKKKSFESMQYLFIKANDDISRYNATVEQTAKIDNEYYGFIGFSDDGAVRVFKSKDRQAIVDKLVSLSHKLNLRIIDFTKEIPDEL